MKGFEGAAIAAAVEVPYQRGAQDITTEGLLAQAFSAVIGRAGLAPRDIDGLGVASFTLAPDRAIDLAWRLGLTPRWTMDDGHGGASGLSLLLHALRAVQAGDANAIVLVAGDHFEPADFRRLQDHYNVTTREHLRPLGVTPNALFAMATMRHMRRHGLQRSDYGALVVAQRAWAQQNPNAVYRSALTLDDYLAAPWVAEPLGRYDCVPVVSGADAVLVTASDHRAAGGRGVRVLALRAQHNTDHQAGDGLVTGLAAVAPALWSDAGVGPDAMDIVSVYDDYPVMSLVQLADLGFAPNGDLHALIHDRVATRRLPLNTSGGQLSAGQAGMAGGMHGLVEAVVQLRGEAGERQVAMAAKARRAVVTGYGMVEYRYGMCANAVVLEGPT